MDLQKYTPLIQDYLDGKPVEGFVNGKWIAIKTLADFETKGLTDLRAAEAAKWYRVAEIGSTTGAYTTNADLQTSQKEIEGLSGFRRWLTDVVFYT